MQTVPEDSTKEVAGDDRKAEGVRNDKEKWFRKAGRFQFYAIPKLIDRDI